MILASSLWYRSFLLFVFLISNVCVCILNIPHVEAREHKFLQNVSLSLMHQLAKHFIII